MDKEDKGGAAACESCHKRTGDLVPSHIWSDKWICEECFDAECRTCESEGDEPNG